MCLVEPWLAAGRAGDERGGLGGAGCQAVRGKAEVLVDPGFVDPRLNG